MPRYVFLRSFAAAALVVVPVVAGSQAPPSPPPAPTQDYWVYVASEATDKVAVVRFGPAGARVEREITVGMLPMDVDGPHGLAVSPDGRFWYASTAHGTPFGHLAKYTTAGDELVGRVMLGDFPATTQVSPNGALAFVVNFNLHGAMVPSSVSVVATEEMVEIARIQTCTMPHGSRLNSEGTRHYSACMMDDMVVEIDAGTLTAARHFMVAAGSEHGSNGPPMRHGAGAGHDMGGHSMGASGATGPSCSPTWAQPSASGASLFVACNKANDIVEIDVANWKLVRRIPAGPGVYNLAVTRDGRLLIATNKRGQSVSVIDIATGKELARLATRRPVVHGVAVSPDDRYAFISVEGVGAEPGTVEVIDLRGLRTVATVDVGQMAGGIDVWKMERPR